MLVGNVSAQSMHRQYSSITSIVVSVIDTVLVQVSNIKNLYTNSVT